MSPREKQSSALVYHQVVRRFEAAPPGKLLCLHGDTPEVFRLSLHAASHALLRGVPVALVDGANRFDVYSIAEFARWVASRARQRVTPGQLLERIHVARAFTCYQMEATITERLPAFLKQNGVTTAMIFGLLDTFYDEQAPLFEVKASLQRIIVALQQLKAENTAVLLASMDVRLESKERNMLFPKLVATMDQAVRLSHGNNSRSLSGGGLHGKDGPDIHTGYSGGNGHVVQVPARFAQRGSGSHGRSVSRCQTAACQ